MMNNLKTYSNKSRDIDNIIQVLQLKQRLTLLRIKFVFNTILDVQMNAQFIWGLMDTRTCKDNLKIDTSFLREDDIDSKPVRVKRDTSHLTESKQSKKSLSTLFHVDTIHSAVFHLNDLLTKFESTTTKYNFQNDYGMRESQSGSIDYGKNPNDNPNLNSNTFFVKNHREDDPKYSICQKLRYQGNLQICSKYFLNGAWNNNIATHRRKRELCSWCGSIMRSIYGTAKVEDVQAALQAMKSDFTIQGSKINTFLSQQSTLLGDLDTNLAILNVSLSTIESKFSNLKDLTYKTTNKISKLTDELMVIELAITLDIVKINSFPVYSFPYKYNVVLHPVYNKKYYVMFYPKYNLYFPTKQ